MAKKNEKIILNILLNFLLCCASYLVSKKRNFFLVGARKGDSFTDNSKYLYLYANKIKDKHSFIWITKSKKVFDQLKKRGLPVIFRNSVKAFWLILRAKKLIISNTPENISYYRLLPGRFKFIEMWHGSPMKEFPFASKGDTLKSRIHSFILKWQYSNNEFVLHTCERTKEQLENCFVTKKVKILGYPRNDGLFKSTNFEEIPNIKRYKKILFYLPTFRDKKSSKAPFTEQGLKNINNLLKEKNHLLLVKKHFAEKNWEVKEGYSNILDVSYMEDCQEVLSKTDLLITDYSGVAFDFSLLNKPIIFYPYDYEEYKKKSRKIIIDYFKEIPGPFAYNEKELIKLIKDEGKWFKNKGYQKRYEEFVKKFNAFRDENSSKRVYEEIINQK